MNVRQVFVRGAFLGLGILCLCPGLSKAVLVFPAEEVCPICDSQVAVLHLVSYGSYIYHRACKYDLIYFPDDDPRFIWMCPNCGYAQIYDEFHKITQNQREKLRKQLPDIWTSRSPNDITIASPNDISSIKDRLEQATLVNTILDKSDDFWALFNRILIYHYRKVDPAKARELAKEEIRLLEKGKGEFLCEEKCRPYLLGEYNRMVQNYDVAAHYFAVAKQGNLVKGFKAAMAFLVGADIFFVVLIVSMWIRRKERLIKMIVSSIFALIAVTMCSGSLYIIPRISEYYTGLGGYYDQIIDERVALLPDTSHQESYIEPEEQQ